MHYLSISFLSHNQFLSIFLSLCFSLLITAIFVQLYKKKKKDIMENSVKTDLETETGGEMLEVKPPQVQTAKKSRKVDQKTVVKVRIDGYGGKQRSEGPPSDFWSWRKYGQKPIKGSPYPRGYYKCSTSKGCSAKKQVERCKTDASLLLITYTSSHNHPGPNLETTASLTPNQPQKPETQLIEEIPTTPNEQQDEEEEEEEEGKTPLLPASSNPAASDEEPIKDNFHYLESSSKDSSINQEDNPFIIDQLDNTHELLGFVFVEEPMFYPQTMDFSTPTKPDENDFFDELEELPTSSSLNSFMRSSLLDERILLQPS